MSKQLLMSDDAPDPDLRDPDDDIDEEPLDAAEAVELAALVGAL